MGVFAVISPTPDPELAERIGTASGGKCFAYSDRSWLVKFDGTSMKLARELKADGDGDQSAIVLSVSSYYGRANPQIWEWLRTHWE